jgi:hypothetical protein
MVTKCKNQGNSLEFEITTQFKSDSYGLLVFITRLEVGFSMLMSILLPKN